MNYPIENIHKGQALVTLLFFVIISITITSAAVVIILLNSTSTTKVEQGTRAYYLAESGAENAILRFLRNPGYTGETMTIGDGTVTATVSGTGPYTISSQGRIGNFVRKILVSLSFTGGVLTVNSWKEVP